MTDYDNPDDFKVSRVLNKEVRHVAYGWIAAIIALVVAIGIVLAVGGFVGGWWSEAQRQISPTNVKIQFAFAYDDLNAMKAEARQICTAQQAVKAATDPTVQSQRETQLLTEENNYNRIAGEYDAHLADIFRTKIIKPSDVPSRAPALTDMLVQVCG